MKKYDLIPKNGRKSFYGKAVVEVGDDNSETLYSYGYKIIRKNADGTLHRLFPDDAKLSITTSTHIISFCGLHKKDFLALPLEV